jgi:hypothetical protein
LDANVNNDGAACNSLAAFISAVQAQPGVLTSSMHIALANLKLDELRIVYPGAKRCDYSGGEPPMDANRREWEAPSPAADELQPFDSREGAFMRGGMPVDPVTNKPYCSAKSKEP